MIVIIVKILPGQLILSQAKDDCQSYERCNSSAKLIQTTKTGMLCSRFFITIMEKVVDGAQILQTEGMDESGKRIKHCRRCKFACIAVKSVKYK
jgi:hypothetical protein